MMFFFPSSRYVPRLLSTEAATVSLLKLDATHFLEFFLRTTSFCLRLVSLQERTCTL
jgi:hypothetical protein